MGDHPSKLLVLLTAPDTYQVTKSTRVHTPAQWGCPKCCLEMPLQETVSGMACAAVREADHLALVEGIPPQLNCGRPDGKAERKGSWEPCKLLLPFPFHLRRANFKLASGRKRN